MVSAFGWFDKHFVTCSLQPHWPGSKKLCIQMHFAHMLGEIFAGHPNKPCRPPNLTEPPWTLDEFECAVRRVKIHRGEAGLEAELLKNSSGLFYTGNFPSCWSKKIPDAGKKRNGLNNHLATSPLPTSVCCIKHLPS